MKKTVKILTALLIACALFFTIAQPVVFADDPAAVLNGLNTNQTVGTTEMTDIGSKVMSFIWVLSIIVAVVVLMYTGLKFIVGSANEKAEYKKSLVPIVVGVLILVFATTIIRALFSIKG